ncbi:MAG TPA: hypothetical protein VGO58_03115 [Chitinophagaceae bacterium]|jgi:hypothetical protein|nr:hypothetical protein [Chitinophagaceae bacterium]
MKKSNQLIVFLFVIGLFFNSKSYSQCDPCPPNTNPVPQASVDKYKENYANNFRTNTARRKTHSISVDFSRQSIIEFYKRNFIDIVGVHSGMNIIFISYGDIILPGQKHKDQIGLMIRPADLNCKSVASAFSIANNSFDQKQGSHSNTPFSNLCGATEGDDFKRKYGGIYPAISKNQYTTRIHFKVEMLQLIYDFLIADVALNYKGIRFDFGSYNAPDMACGQADPNQISLFISPVFKDGSADLNALFKFIDEKYKTLKNGIRIRDTFNHGELCPKICD